DVIAALAVDDIAAGTDGNHVVALAPNDVFDGRQRIRSDLGAGRDGGGHRRPRGGERQVVGIGARPPGIGVGAVVDSGDEPVVTGPARERIRSGAIRERVVPGTTGDVLDVSDRGEARGATTPQVHRHGSG